MTSRGAGAQRPRLTWQVRLLLGSYPPWWRIRYDDEMRDTLLALRESGHWQARDGWDLVRGLVEAWLNPTSFSLEDAMTDPSRRSIPRTAWGLLLFVLAGSGFAKVIEDPPFSAAAQQHTLLGWCVDALTVAAGGTAVVMTAATLPSVVTILRQPSGRGWHQLAALLVAPASGAAFIVALVVARGIADSAPGHRTSQVVAFLLLLAVTVLGGICTTVALVRVATRVPDSPRVEVVRRVATVSVAVCTAVAALAVLGWTLALAVETPHLLHTRDGLLSTPTLPTLATVLAGLVAAAVLCGRSGVGVLFSREAAPRSSR